MGVLARRCPDESPLDYHRWVEPLLFIAADAAAVKDQAIPSPPSSNLTQRGTWFPLILISTQKQKTSAFCYNLYNS
jgi:hypothetical protein